ncbi:hypothetical protein H4F45_09700 [Pectobacterium brasiliense]|uniref:Secreted protein n=1 Tax=Pectobacterium brasiliense TaxID=180957 RepID=A0AAE3BEQ8_9GAMM|nr:hypothetical protein [Pectobacterium brasiliense]MBN3051743.1 hypothetical protein [Pectobacterium brasiliense]
MKKLITVTIMAIAAFSWFITHNTTEPEKDLPTNATFIIKSERPGTCRVSTMATVADTKQNVPIVACKVQL